MAETEEGQDVPMEGDGERPNKVFCFLNCARVCGGDCMAYQWQPRENKELEEHQQKCMLLQAAERTGRSTSIISGLVHQYVEVALKDIIDQRNKAMDAERGAGPRPPNPTGTI